MSKKIVFPWTHSIGKLLELAEKSGLKVPPKVKKAVPLSEYAVASRYPGEYDPVQESDYLEALQSARDVYEWAKRKMEARK